MKCIKNWGLTLTYKFNFIMLHETIVGMIGGKWKLRIIYMLAFHEVLRYGELKRLLAPLTHYQFCKFALRCVFIFAPIYYHITAYFSIKMGNSLDIANCHITISLIYINLHGASTMSKIIIKE